jgi:hypothetical protein
VNPKGLAVIFAILGACGSSGSVTPTAQPSDGSAEKLESISCTFSYVPRAGREGRQETLSVETEQGSQGQAVRFGQMVARISYFDDGFESPAFNVVVRSPGHKEDITARLYQLERTSDEPSAPAKRPENEFVGGHGFTGLGYVFDPDSKAELQYWCEAS